MSLSQEERADYFLDVMEAIQYWNIKIGSAKTQMIISQIFSDIGAIQVNEQNQVSLNPNHIPDSVLTQRLETWIRQLSC